MQEVLPRRPRAAQPPRLLGNKAIPGLHPESFPSALNLHFHSCPRPHQEALLVSVWGHPEKRCPEAPTPVPFACQVALPWVFLLNYKVDTLPAPPACRPPRGRHAVLLLLHAICPAQRLVARPGGALWDLSFWKALSRTASVVAAFPQGCASLELILRLSPVLWSPNPSRLKWSLMLGRTVTLTL